MTDTEKIRLLRRQRELDQASMAKMLHIAQSTYSDIESGKSKLTEKMKKDIL